MLDKTKKRGISRNDFITLAIIVVIAILWQRGWHGMHAQMSGSLPAEKLSFKSLAYGLLRTNMRLLIGLFWSVIFAFVAGIWAAKSKHAAYFILPFINFMESVPLVGFMTFSILFFTHLYPHSVMGLECAAIFGVFTGQAWNMALSFYQSLVIVPKELLDAAEVFRLSAWKKLWKIELPYAFPALLWNTMVSQSAAWFALVGTETIAMGMKSFVLPGVGSYIQAGLDASNAQAIIYAILAIVANIVVFDQLFFRPLVRWSEQFKFEKNKSQQKNSSWAFTVYRNAHAFSTTGRFIKRKLVQCNYHLAVLLPKRSWKLNPRTKKYLTGFVLAVWYLSLSVVAIYYGMKLFDVLPKIDTPHMIYLMWLTTLRVLLAMLLSLLIFLPLGVWIGLKPRLTRFFQPIIQVFAALPPDILYPIVAVLLITFHANLSWWTVPLIMIGTQWYVLFNVIAGVSAIPQEILDVGSVFSIKGVRYWRKIIIPAIFPSIVTGIISAAGGAWNADIMAEIIHWGTRTLSATGLGAFISSQTALNHPSQEALGCILMCVLVALCIIFIWRPLYNLAERRYKIN